MTIEIIITDSGRVKLLVPFAKRMAFLQHESLPDNLLWENYREMLV